MTTQQTETLRKIKTAFETNNTPVIERVNAIFGLPNDLTGVLLEKYDELGQTPIDEPELFKTLIDGEGVFAFAKGLASKFGIKASDFPMSDYASFINACKEKITSFTDNEGKFKSTPATENAKMPTFDDLEKLGNLSTELQKSAVDAVNINSEEVRDAFNKAKKKHQDAIFKVTGVKKKDLTEWEVNLLTENVMSYTADVMNTMLGRSL